MLDISRRYNQVKTRQRVAIMPPNFAIQQRPNPTELGFDLNNVLAWTAREAQFNHRSNVFFPSTSEVG